INVPPNARWTLMGVTVARDLNGPHGLCVIDDDDNSKQTTIIIADSYNHRIVQYKTGNTTNGQIIAGDNGQGDQLNQLNSPIDVLYDKETDNLIIADWGNRRVLRWSRRSGTKQGEILIDNIKCHGLFLNDQRNLYCTVTEKQEIRRYQLDQIGEDKKGTLVAGGNGNGANLNQLNWPTYIFIDRHQNVYVSDNGNHRVMKWNKDARGGIVVAGGHAYGNAVKQLYHPNGLFVDTSGTLYVVDFYNNRVMRWTQGAQEGTIVVGGNGEGAGANQFSYPTSLSIDRHGNLYVVDRENKRVQQFTLA
ncbi:unnamed protein product, partial [Rotaria sp. Silwood2]